MIRIRSGIPSWLVPLVIVAGVAGLVCSQDVPAVKGTLPVSTDRYRIQATGTEGHTKVILLDSATGQCWHWRQGAPSWTALPRISKE